MPRPCKRRRIRGRPSSHFFKPAGISNRELKQTELELEEFEAIRLKDYLELDQKKCAEEMNISQPTFHRLLNNARKKIADSIINGKSLKINKNLNNNPQANS